jgi:carbamoyltransferase
MRILGLSSLKPDTAAALLEDGVPTAAIESDKIERGGGHDRSYAAIQSCFDTVGINWDGIDMVAVATRPFRSWSRKSLLRTTLSALGPAASAYHGVNELGALTRELGGLRILRRSATGSGHKALTFDHHLCHAAGAFFASSFDRALIVTMNETGDGNSATLAVGEGNRIRVLRTIAFPHSLAWVYSQITALVGFRPHREEHKTQWLSLEGQPVYKDVFRKMLQGRDRTRPRLDFSFFNRSFAHQLSFSEKFYREVGLPADIELEESQRKALASSIQAACSEIVTDVVEDLRRREGIQEVCFAGGLFQNVLLVASLERNLGMTQVFVPPAPGNAGASLGAARLVWHRVLQKPRNDTPPHAYLGPKFDRNAIRDVLENSKNRYVFSNTEERKLDVGVQLLQSGKIIGWFQGAAEFGPRALGNRSVLASPWAAYVKENLNDFIKHREWFRPFAISVPEEDCEKYFEASPQCRFMNSVGTVRPGADCLPESFLLPNRQVRLHVVDRRSNPAFWSLLKRFGEEAPAPMLLNTSFNLFGEPLVVTPRDAMRSYFSSGLDALIMDRFILSKAALPVSAAKVPVHRVGLGA